MVLHQGVFREIDCNKNQCQILFYTSKKCHFSDLNIQKKNIIAYNLDKVLNNILSLVWSFLGFDSVPLGTYDCLPF